MNYSLAHLMRLNHWRESGDTEFHRIGLPLDTNKMNDIKLHVHSFTEVCMTKW